jgi:hypothetical protein
VLREHMVFGHVTAAATAFTEACSEGTSDYHNVQLVRTRKLCYVASLLLATVAALYINVNFCYCLVCCVN